MPVKEFKKEYAKLDERQKEAVDIIDGPVMVIAGPGTGKTTILTLRIANILRLTDTPASGILALSFTEAGVRVMRNKLSEVIGERALDVAIHTFHSFAASIMAEFNDHFPHLSRSRQITDVEAEVFLRQILSQKKFSRLRPIGNPDFYIPKIIEGISNAKQEAWMPEMLKSFAKEEIKRVKNNSNSISSRGKSRGLLKAEILKHIEKCERTVIFADIYEAYEAKKIEERKIDFDDLIFELLKTLRKDKLLLRIIQEKFLYILLDEHQDTNDSQNLIVRTIADFFETPNLFVVGDEKQAIYRFQGASVENFLSFQKIWSQMKVIFLTNNYRSHQYLLDASFKMIEKNYAEKEHNNLHIRLKSMAQNKTKPLDFIIAPNIDTEEVYLTEKLQKLLKTDKVDTVAIIVRKNNEVARIFSLLERSSIPAQAEKGANIFSHPVGKLYFSLLEFFSNPENTDALAETFVSGLWGLSFTKQVKLIKSLKSGDLLEIEKEIPMIFELQKEMNNVGAMEYLLLVADLSGFSQVIRRGYISVEVWRGIITLAEDLIRASEIENPKSLIEKLLSYKKSAERRQIKISAGQTLSRITIMTAHASKGLEFDYVFLPYATEESWIRKNRGSYFILPKEKSGNDDIRDERRLFYVALTRARKHVSISFHTEDNLGKTETALRFVDELDQNLISSIKLPKTNKSRAPQSLKKIKTRQNFEQIEYAKNVLLKNGLSVTALNHFIECPNKFFYKSILKLPEAPNASSEKGSAMHEALAMVWKDITHFLPEEQLPDRKISYPSSEDNGFGNNESKDISKIITSTVKEYLEHSFLPLCEKEAVLDELILNAPKVARALKEHFSQKGIIFTENWVETFFVDKTKKDMRLHGKLDALIDRGDKLLVYDYKTREAISLRAIKGETRGSDGSYFRQLIFYKILLEGNNRFKNRIIEPALVFVKPDKNGRCPTIFLPINKSDTEKVKSEISNLLETIWSGKLLSQTCDDKSCRYCGYRGLLS